MFFQVQIVTITNPLRSTSSTQDSLHSPIHYDNTDELLELDLLADSYLSH